MFAMERQARIVRLVREKKRLDFQELQKAIGASPATLRRDLGELEKSGAIIRVHGGLLDPAHVRSEPTVAEKASRHRSAKRSIAARAVEEVADGMTVFVDAGSTCHEAALLLLRRPRVRIVTHSVTVLSSALAGCEAEVLCPGGTLRVLSGALVAGDALEGLNRLRADVAFLGASGLDAEGCTTTEILEAGVKRTMIHRSARRILLADRSKWNAPSAVLFASWSDWNLWITNRPPPGPAPAVKIIAAERGR